MKKTLILLLALVGIIGAATLFYNNYQKNISNIQVNYLVSETL